MYKGAEKKMGKGQRECLTCYLLYIAWLICMYHLELMICIKDTGQKQCRCDH